MASTANARTAAPRRKPARRASSSARARAKGGPGVRVAGGIRWDRVARITLLLVLVAILISYVGPATSYLQSWKLAGQTKAEVQNLRRDNARLRVKARLLENPAQVELEARRMGMARPGERVYVVRNLPRGH
jgi:cell division protein FtsB